MTSLAWTMDRPVTSRRAGIRNDLVACAFMAPCLFLFIVFLLLPAIATVAIFTFVRSWNDFFWPLVISNTDATRTVPVGLAIFVGRGLSMRFGVVMASAAAATTPAVIFFLMLQRYFVRGISTTGLRG